MTFADFLFQAGFWQWCGIIILTAYAAHGIGNFRLWGNVTKNKSKNYSEARAEQMKKDQP